MRNVNKCNRNWLVCLYNTQFLENSPHHAIHTFRIMGSQHSFDKTCKTKRSFLNFGFIIVSTKFSNSSGNLQQSGMAENCEYFSTAFEVKQ